MTDIAGRRCVGCGVFKEWAYFHQKKGGVFDRHSRCKSCVSDSKRKFWLSKRKTTRRKALPDVEKMEVIEVAVPFTQSDRADLERMLRSMVLNSILNPKDGVSQK